MIKVQTAIIFKNAYIQKQSVTGKICVEYWLKELQKVRIGALATAIYVKYC